MASTHTITERETANRTRVALHLADAIEHAAQRAGVHEGVDGVAAGLNQLGWQLAVALARELYPEWTPADGYEPSMLTRAATITVLRDRADHPDPFDGFPTTS
jgi:hypothetical protein